MCRDRPRGIAVGCSLAALGAELVRPTRASARDGAADLFDEAIARDIQKAWEEDQNHPHRDRDVRPFPDLKAVLQLVELCFFLSMTKEEGRLQRASIAFVTKEEILGETHRYSKDVRAFSKPFPAVAQQLAKVCPAFDVRTSVFLVAADPENRLMCWGVVLCAATENGLEGLPIVVGEGQFFRPDSLTVTATGIGSLQVSRADFKLGTIGSGGFTPSTPSPFAARALGRFLLPFVEADPLWKKHEMSLWHSYRDALETLLLEASARGEGGAIALLPSEDSATSLIDHGLRIEPTIELMPDLERVLSTEHLIQAAWARRALERIKEVAQLTSVDGAVVISTRLELISFGSKFRSGKWPHDLKPGTDSYGKSIPGSLDRERLGTRHNSAIDFVGSCSRAIVFVLSQDGPIRAFAKESQNRLLYWPDCSESVFV